MKTAITANSPPNIRVSKREFDGQAKLHPASFRSGTGALYTQSQIGGFLRSDCARFRCLARQLTQLHPDVRRFFSC